MKRILIIGGTGMLQDAANYFIEHDFDVTIVARDKRKLNAFTKVYLNKSIHLISQDYTDTEAFIAAIQNDIKQHGSYDCVISWIHSPALESTRQLIQISAKANPHTVFYHIKGSASYNPATRHPIDPSFKVLDYREIILGFKRESHTSRWLTNEEIAQGIIDAFKTNAQKYVIGVIEPWDQWP